MIFETKYFCCVVSKPNPKNFIGPTNVDDDFLGPSKRRKLAQDLSLDDPIAEYVKSPFILDVAEFIDSDLDLSKPDIGKLRKAPPPPLQSLSTR